MRTNEVRARLIRQRTEELRREAQKKRRRRLDFICAAACLLLIIGTGILMPDLMAGIGGRSVSHASGAASLVGNHAALGYILMGLMAFLLGVCVTVLLYRLHRKSGHREDGSGEL